MEFILYYLAVGYILNNAIGLYSIYTYDDVEIDFANFIITIPAWPYTLYSVISNLFSKEE